MSCCIEMYECAERGCYAESVGVIGCSGVASRLMEHEAGTWGCSDTVRSEEVPAPVKHMRVERDENSGSYRWWWNGTALYLWGSAGWELRMEKVGDTWWPRTSGSRTRRR